MTAAVRDLAIEQGSTFTLGFNWHREGETVDGVVQPGDPYDLTGCSARMQIRRKQGDPVLFTATSAPPVDAAAISAGAGRIVLGGASGRIDITLTDEDTDVLSSRTAVYDLEIEWPLPTRNLTAGVTLDSPVITATAGAFTSGDIGYRVTGTEVPPSTVIVGVAADGSTATMSSNATATNATAALTLTSSLKARVDRLLQGTVTVSPNVTQVTEDVPPGPDPVVT